MTPTSAELIDEIIRMSDYSFERLPMLDIVGGRLAGYLPVALSDLTNCACEAIFSQVDYVPLGQAIATFPKPLKIAICSSPLFDGDFLLVMDAPLIISCLETSLGGILNDQDLGEREEFTSIEHGFAKRLAMLILGDLRQSFSVIGDIEPSFLRLENDAEASAVTQHANLCVRFEFSLKVGAQASRLILVLPYDALETLRPQLSKVHFGEGRDDENPWESVLSRQIESATVDLEVVLSKFSMPMRRIMDLKPGDQIGGWAVEEDKECTIFCSGSPLFMCETGTRKNGAAAVRIVKELTLNEEA